MYFSVTNRHHRASIFQKPQNGILKMNSNEFKQQVIPLYRAMYGVAMAMLGGDTTQAEDAVQDTMLRLWDHREHLPEISSIKAYSIRAVRNRCLELLRSSTREENLEETSVRLAVDAASIPSQKKAEDAVEKLEQVTKLIAQLPDAQQDILKMRAFADLDNEEIAQTLGINNTTVRQQLSRARKTLRSLMTRKRD